MKSIVANGFLAVFAVILLTACEPADPPEPASEPVFEDAWIRPAPPGMKMTAAYGTLRNVTGESIDIESFSSPQLGHISLHRTQVVDGVSRMGQVDIYSVAPGSSLVMEPGSYHLMISMPGMPVVEGTLVRLDVHTADGRTFSFEVPVEKR